MLARPSFWSAREIFTFRSKTQVSVSSVLCLVGGCWRSLALAAERKHGEGAESVRRSVASGEETAKRFETILRQVRSREFREL